MHYKACFDFCHHSFIADYGLLYIVNEIGMYCRIIFKALLKYYFN